MCFGGRSNDLGYFIATFRKSPEILCSGVLQATHDFRGNVIQDLGYLNIPADWLTFSLVATGDGGAAVFSWPGEHVKSENVIKTLIALADDALPHAITRFAFEFFENTYFSPDWWDHLDESVQTSIRKRQLSGEGLVLPRSDRCLLDDGVRAVNWQISSRISSITST